MRGEQFCDHCGIDTPVIIGLMRPLFAGEGQVKSKPIAPLFEGKQFITENQFVRRPGRIKQQDWGRSDCVRARWRIIETSGTTPEPPPISRIGPPSSIGPDKMPANRTAQFDLIADCRDIVEESGDFAVVQSLDGELDDFARTPEPMQSNSCAVPDSRRARSNERRRAGPAIGEGLGMA